MIKETVRSSEIFLKYYCFRTLSKALGNFVPNGFPIGFEMAEKNGNKQTDKQTNKHFRIYISRDYFFKF